MLSSLTTQPSLPNPDYAQWLRERIDVMRRQHAKTDDWIRQNFLMGAQGLDSATAHHLLPAPEPAPPAATAAPGSATPKGGLMTAALQLAGDPLTPLNPIKMATLGVSPDEAAKLGEMVPGALATALRGVTLGASDYVPKLKDLARSYREQAGSVDATLLEVGAGVLFNPFSWIKRVQQLPKAVRAVGEFMSPGRREPVSGFVQGVKNVAAGAGRGAAYSGIVGFNEAEGGFVSRGITGAAAAVPGTFMGAVFGTGAAATEHLAAKRLAREAGMARPYAASLLRESQRVQLEASGGRAPVFFDGEPLANSMGPLDRSLAMEAVRRSPNGLALLNHYKEQYARATPNVILETAHDITNVPRLASQARDIPELAERLALEGDRRAAGYWRALNQNNPDIPIDAAFMERVAQAGPVMRFLTGRGFRDYATTQAAADAGRLARGDMAWGAVDDANSIRRTLLLARANQQGDPASRLAQLLPPEMQTSAEGLRNMASRVGAGSLPTETPTLKWRTLHVLKMALDRKIGGSDIRGLEGVDTRNLIDVKRSLVDLLKAGTGGEEGLYASALRTTAGGRHAAELVLAGQQAARQGPAEVRQLLRRPDVLAEGEAAAQQAKLGVLAEIHNQITRDAFHPEQAIRALTPARVGMLQAVIGENTPAAERLAARVEAAHRTLRSFDGIPGEHIGITTGVRESQQAGLAGMLAAGGFGVGVGWRGANLIQRQAGKMNPKDAEDLIHFLWNPNNTQSRWELLMRGAFSPSRGPEVAGRTIGNAIGTAFFPTRP